MEYDFIDDNEIRAFYNPCFYDDKLFKLKTMDHVTGLSQLIGSLVKSKDWEYENKWCLTLLQTDSKIEKKESAYTGNKNSFSPLSYSETFYYHNTIFCSFAFRN